MTKTALTTEAADIATLAILVGILNGTDTAAKALLLYRDDTNVPSAAPAFTPAAVRAALNAAWKITTEAAGLADLPELIDILNGVDTTKSVIILRDDTNDPSAAPAFTPAAVSLAVNDAIAKQLGFNASDVFLAEIKAGTRYYASATTSTATGVAEVTETVVVKASLEGTKHDPAWHIIAASDTAALVGKFAKRDTLIPKAWKGLFRVIGG